MAVAKPEEKHAMRGACIGCDRLPKCRYATADMIARETGCELWSATPLPVIRARFRVMELFNPAAILAIPNPPRKENTMEGAQRATLRKLAVKLGLVEPSAKSFSISRETLIEKLKDKVADIDGMSEADVQGLIEGNVEAPKTAAAKPGAKPGTAGPKPGGTAPKPGAPKPGAKPTPKEEPVEEEVEEAPKAKPGTVKPGAPKPGGAKPGTAGPKPGAPKPGGVKPGAPKAAPKEEAATPEETDSQVGTVDLTPVIERVDAIGQLVDKSNKATAAAREELSTAREELAAVNAKLDQIGYVLTVLYNGAVEEEYQVESIFEIDLSS